MGIIFQKMQPFPLGLREQQGQGCHSRRSLNTCHRKGSLTRGETQDRRTSGGRQRGDAAVEKRGGWGLEVESGVTEMGGSGPPWLARERR